MRPQRLIRDWLVPLTGLFVFVYGLVTHQLQWWMAPLIAGMVGVPLVALGDVGPPSGQPPAEPAEPTPQLPPAEEGSP